MMENSVLRIVIRGRIPSKKNSKIKARNGIFSSKEYESWRRSALLQLSAAGLQSWKESFEMSQFRIFFPDNRRADLTNKADSIQDVLTEYGIWKDDDWKNTGIVVLVPDYDKENPRVEITLKRRA